MKEITPLVLKRHAKYLTTDMWQYNDKPFTYDLIGDYIGFVYLIIDDQGKRYIGRKNFWSTKSVTVEGKKRKRKISIMSDWMTYHSSNEFIKAGVKAGRKYTRIILSLHSKQSELNYSETAAIFTSGALYKLNNKGEPLYFNNHVDNKYYQRNYLGLNTRSQYNTKWSVYLDPNA